MRWRLLLLTALLLAVSCDDRDHGPSTGRLEGEVGECRSGEMPPGRQADMDGDGTGDPVTLGPGSGSERCSFTLLVETTSGSFTAGAFVPGFSDRARPPQLLGFPDIDRDGSAEVLVSMFSGASTEFISVYRLGDDGLELPSPPAPATEVPVPAFAHGGGVGALSAVACWDGGDADVVTSRAAPRDARARAFLVQRRFLDLTPGGWRRAGTETFEAPVRRVTRLPEFRASPFGNCTSG